MPEAQRIVVVTGGAQGIGKGIARRFLRDGALVQLVDSDPEAGAEAVAELAALGEEGSGGGEARFFQADVAREEDVQCLLQALEAEHGGLDVLVNNAGITAFTPLPELSLARWNRVLGVNLTGAFLCSKHLAPLLARRRGAIVNIASTRALMSEPGSEAYAASKGGLVALTHALALSLGPQVRVNCISPGWIEVSAWKKRSARRAPELGETDHLQHPAGRVGRPEDVAALAAFLAAPENDFITGANYTLDGGMTRKMIYAE